MMFNAPDEHGEVQVLRPGAVVELSWYRRTDGEQGEVEADPSNLWNSRRVHGPVSWPFTIQWAHFTADRESPKSLVEIDSSLTVSTPVLGRLGTSHSSGHGAVVVAGWFVVGAMRNAPWSRARCGPCRRCPDPESLRVARELRRAGPEQLLVVLGQEGDALSDEDLDWARNVVRTWFDESVIESRPYALDCDAVLALADAGRGDAKYGLPTFDARQMSGNLVDSEDGRHNRTGRATTQCRCSTLRRCRCRGSLG